MSIKRILARTAAGVFVLCLMARTVTFAWGAPSDADQLISLGMHPAIAKKLVEVVNTLASPFTNNTWVTVRNAANGANINVLKVDSSDETILNADSGDSVHLQVAGTDVAVVSSTAVTASQDVGFASGKTIALQEATAGSACSGTATANGTTAVTVSTTCAATGSRIVISRNAAPSGTAICWATNIVAATSFDLDCSGAETSTFNWVIFHEAA